MLLKNAGGILATGVGAICAYSNFKNYDTSEARGRTIIDIGGIFASYVIAGAVATFIAGFGLTAGPALVAMVITGGVIGWGVGKITY